MVDRGLSGGEGLWPGVEVVGDGVHGLVVAARRARVDHDQGADQVGLLAGEHERPLAAEGVADQDRRRDAELVDHVGGVGDVGLGGDVVGVALAVALAAGVEGEDPRALGQPARRLGPLAGVAAEAGEDQDRRAVAAVVEAGEADAVSLEVVPGGHARQASCGGAGCYLISVAWQHGWVMVDAVADLEQGRECFAEQSWERAYELLSAADEHSGLGPEDLEALASSAYMVGRDAEYVDAMERAHRGYVDAGQPHPAARCGFWAGLNLLARGEQSRANGWFGQVERLLAREGGECIEQGYLLIPDLLAAEDRGDAQAAYATASKTAAIAERFGDPDLMALTMMSQGHALVRLGRREEGMRLVDETLVMVTTGRLSPIVSGIIYCSTIDFCQSVYELRRAREWTEALTRWWEQQPEMVAYTGVCLVHRAEIMEMAGAWQDALDEARRAHDRFERGTASGRAIGRGHYRQGELHRLRGEFAEAEAAYGEAAGCGCEPQPGLALLRLAQGRDEDAAAGIRRALGEAHGDGPAEPAARVRRGHDRARRDRGGARGGRRARAERRATAEHAARRDRRARPRSHRARRWQSRATPWSPCAAASTSGRSSARRMRRRAHACSIGTACRALGDEDAAALELDAARAAFAELGAVTDLGRLDST